LKINNSAEHINKEQNDIILKFNKVPLEAKMFIYLIYWQLPKYFIYAGKFSKILLIPPCLHRKDAPLMN